MRAIFKKLPIKRSTIFLIILVIFGVVLLFASSAGATPAYGTRMPAKKQAFWGLQHYYIKNADLDNDLGSVHSHQNYLTLSYGLTEWFSLDLKASLYSTFRHNSESGDAELQYKHSVWGGGYGFRIKAYESGPVKAVVGFQHFSIHPRTVKANGEKNNGILEDWQGSALVSYDLKRCTPYIGVRYTMLDYIHRRNKERNTIKSDDSRRFEPVVGVDIPVSGKVWINLEGAGGAQDALAASLNFHF